MIWQPSAVIMPEGTSQGNVFAFDGKKKVMSDAERKYRLAASSTRYVRNRHAIDARVRRILGPNAVSGSSRTLRPGTTDASIRRNQREHAANRKASKAKAAA